MTTEIGRTGDGVAIRRPSGPAIRPDRPPDGQSPRLFGLSAGRIGAVVLAGMLGGIAALAVSMQQQPVYQAAAGVVIESGVRESLYDNGATPARVVETEARIVTSPEVRAAVDQLLGTDSGISAVSVVPVGNSSTFDIIVRASSPGDAAAAANAYAGSYVELRRKQVLDDLDAAERQVQAKITQLQTESDALTQRVMAARVDERALIDQTVAVRQSTLISNQGVFRQQLDQLQVARALRTGGVRVLAEATPIASPVEPLVERNVVLGVSCGLLLGLGLALLFR